MKLHRMMRQACLLMLGAAALCGLSACVGSDDDKPSYWQITSHEDQAPGTAGDIFGGFN